MKYSYSVNLWLTALAAAAFAGGGIAHAGTSVPEAQLETFLNIPQGSLTGLNNGPVMNGSGLMQTVTVSAGATLSFDYTFLTNAPPPASVGLLNALDPFGFAVVGANLTPIVDNYTSYPNVMQSAPPQTGYLYDSGSKTFTTTFLTAGTYTLGFGVVDVTTDAYSSGLVLDNFQLTGGSIANGSFETGNFAGWSAIGNANVDNSSFGIAPTDGSFEAILSTASVPEPSSVILLALGGVGIAALMRRRRSKRSIIDSQ